MKLIGHALGAFCLGAVVLANVGVAGRLDGFGRAGAGLAEAMAGDWAGLARSADAAAALRPGCRTEIVYRVPAGSTGEAGRAATGVERLRCEA